MMKPNFKIKGSKEQNYGRRADISNEFDEINCSKLAAEGRSKKNERWIEEKTKQAKNACQAHSLLFSLITTLYGNTL